MENANRSTKTYAQAKRFMHQRWLRFVDYMKRKRHERRANQKPESPEQRAIRWTMYATIAIAIFTIVLARVAYLQYVEMRDSGAESSGQVNQLLEQQRRQVAQLTKQAGDTHDLAVADGQQAAASLAMSAITSKQFEASQRLIESQRASISVAFASVLNPVTFHDGGLSFAFSVTMKNNGRLPANKVKIRYKPYFSQWGERIFSEPMERQRDFCSKPNVSQDARVALRGLTSEDTLTILSNETKEWQINFGMGKPTDSEIIEWPPSESKLPQTKRVYPIIVGCVDYLSGVMTEPHQTGFIFEIMRGDPRMPVFITFGEEVRPDDAVVQQYFFGQGKSY